jgi:hypothetical protein
LGIAFSEAKKFRAMLNSIIEATAGHCCNILQMGLVAVPKGSFKKTLRPIDGLLARRPDLNSTRKG